VRQRRQVARRPDGPLRGYHGQNAAGEHVFEQAHECEPHSRSAAPEADEFERHDQAHDFRRQRLPHPAAMRQDEVALQHGDIGRADADDRQFAEARVDSVDRYVAGGDGRDPCRAGGHGGVAGGIEARGDAGAVQSFEFRERNGTRVQDHGHA
jgi:hypothetical protein